MKTADSKKQLKIAFLVNEFPCISETFILDQITGLLDLGHDVRIFAYRAAGYAKQHAAVTGYGLLNKTVYFPPIPHGRWQRLLRLLRILCRYAFRHPLRIWKCLNFKKYGLYESLNHLFFLEPLINADYDIVHCQYGTLGKSWIYLKDIMSVKFVTSFRGYDITKFVQENGPAVYAELFKKGDLFLPVCSYFAKRLQELGCPKERIHVHHSGIDPAEFALRERQTGNGEINLLTVARLVEKKGLEYSIRAAARLIPRHLAARYLIVGEGPLRLQLEKLIHELEMEDHIHLAGALPSDEVKKLMEKAHVFLLISVTARDGDQEGIPASLYEAMAAGLPVISTRHSGIPELVQEGRTGILLDERDVEGLSQRCEYLISHPDRCVEMGRAGRKFVEENFNISKLNRRLVELYEAKDGHRVTC